MQIQLQPHHGSQRNAVTDVYVDLKRNPDFLDFWYVVQGNLADVVIPKPSGASRIDNLWQTTCFELFVRGADSGYQEYNFSPSGDWAAYAFDSYRSGMRDIAVVSPPAISVKQTPWGAVETHITLSLPLGIEALHLGLSAIIEETDGTKSYWALAHGDSPPDFHDPSCFIARLPE